MKKLISKFIDIYGGNSSDVRVFSSPGRVNLIGEHTDYNGGFVFPAAIDYSSTIAVRKSEDSKIKLAATDLSDRVVLEIDSLENYKSLKWGNYQAGVAYILQQSGYDICPCEILFDDTVPFGAGLSSSAAIEVVTSLAFATFSNEKKRIKSSVNMIEMAKLSQKAENEYCGVNCGIMDQFASAMGKKDKAIFLDCKSLEYKYVPLILNDYKIVIANTNKKRALADSKYNERRAECENALEQLKNVYPDINCLRDVTVDMFEKNKFIINNSIDRDRAEHVIYECDRVLKSVEALNNGNLIEFGNLMTQSHNSLKDLYEVTGFELDTMVECSLHAEGCIGSRMTGAGFGGCTVSLVKESSVEKFISSVRQEYENKTRLKPVFYVTNANDGGREIII